jgi:terminal uridylyltransferase
MCLQLPPSSLIKNFEGEGGSTAMASLAEKLEELGMVDVDKARLTARIPVIKFYCKIHSEEEHQNDERGSDTMIECDISMQNPLAVINTALLRNYSALKPEVRILVAIIKRWAKSRDINNPSNHTLSSYGYIIMLLHFLTTHKANNANIEPFYQKKQQMSRQQQSPQLSGCPLLPNLQWMNPHWIQSQLGTPYQELEMQPKNQYTMMHHPSENTFLVNKYFCQLNDEALMMNLHRHLEYHDHHHGKESQCKPLVGRILASFFYYYAYEFDYKKHVVSLQSHSNGVIEREAKSENDGWKSFGQSLCIEDPFETFYDVAHVLKPMSFQRVKREFALAYTKIVESFTNDGNKTGNFGYNLLDKICEDTDTESL